MGSQEPHNKRILTKKKPVLVRGWLTVFIWFTLSTRVLLVLTGHRKKHILMDERYRITSSIWPAFHLSIPSLWASPIIFSQSLISVLSNFYHARNARCWLCDLQLLREITLRPKLLTPRSHSPDPPALKTFDPITQSHVQTLDLDRLWIKHAGQDVLDSTALKNLAPACTLCANSRGVSQMLTQNRKTETNTRFGSEYTDATVRVTRGEALIQFQLARISLGI